MALASQDWSTYHVLQIVFTVGRIHGEELVLQDGVVDLVDGHGVLGDGGDVDGPLGERSGFFLQCSPTIRKKNGRRGD